MNPTNNNGGAYIKPVFATNKNAIVAGSGTDASEVTSSSIDRLFYDSAQIVTGFTTTLAAGKKATLTIKIQDSDDNSTFGTAATIFTGDVATSVAGGTVKDVSVLNIDMAKYKRYVKLLTTFDLSNTATDTAEYVTTINLTGARIVPVP